MIKELCIGTFLLSKLSLTFVMQRGLTEKDRRRNASNECQALRDLVNKLKLELLQSQVETQKVKDQLQCVIYLVRR